MPRYFFDLDAARACHDDEGGYLLDLGTQPTEAATRPQPDAAAFVRYSDTGPIGTVLRRTWAVMAEGEARDHRTAEHLASLAPTYREV